MLENGTIPTTSHIRRRAELYGNSIFFMFRYKENLLVRFKNIQREIYQSNIIPGVRGDKQPRKT